MYIFKTLITKSGIEGSGVFADQDIPKESIVWKFDPDHDLTLSLEDFEKLSPGIKAEVRKVGYASPTSGRWVYPPKNDPARYTNHSETSNNLSVVLDPNISNEPFFTANKEIAKGTELTVNYKEFDDSIKHAIPDWMQQ
ncbi:MAG: SET domain-containing protein-lysine N-methyltransferase [Patescibacteria group bacterium]